MKQLKYNNKNDLNLCRARTGLERFLLRFPFYEVKKQKVEDPEEQYLGIGAMVVVPGEGLSNDV